MKMDIAYRLDTIPSPDQIIDLYTSAGISRPTADKERIKKMYDHSNLVVTAWHSTLLVGVARSLTDFCYCCYLSDLAVRQQYKNKGIGQQLIALTKEKIGDMTMLLLLSAPTAVGYYPKVGFQQVDNGFVIKRTK